MSARRVRAPPRQILSAPPTGTRDIGSPINNQSTPARARTIADLTRKPAEDRAVSDLYTKLAAEAEPMGFGNNQIPKLNFKVINENLLTEAYGEEGDLVLTNAGFYYRVNGEWNSLIDNNDLAEILDADDPDFEEEEDEQEEDELVSRKK